MTADTRGKRLEYARLRAAVRAGRAGFSAVEMGARVARERGMPLATNAYGRWESEKRTPDDGWVAAVGRLAGVDPGWIIFGSQSQAPEPEGYREWLAAQEGETTTPPQSGAAEDQGSSGEGKPRRFVRTTLPDETELVRPQRRRKGKRAG